MKKQNLSAKYVTKMNIWSGQHQESYGPGAVLQWDMNGADIPALELLVEMGVLELAKSIDDVIEAIEETEELNSDNLDGGF